MAPTPDAAGTPDVATPSCQPVAEACNGADDDCDGQTDEALRAPCYFGPVGTDGVGACHGGVVVCIFGEASACEGQVLPTAESCDGVDEDCDGPVDEGVAPATCYDGDRRELSHPRTGCREGTRSCGAERCVGEVRPQGEDGCDLWDEDCDGRVDEGCVCVEGAACKGSRDGACDPGVQACDGETLVACEGRVEATVEGCNGADDDCDGFVDEGDANERCYGGPAGSEGVGACVAGRRTCMEGMASEICEGQVTPTEERCDGRDDDCDGAVDEAFPMLGRACEVGEGVCRATGLMRCADGGAVCDAKPGDPAAELCNARDDDCDGAVDEDAEAPCYEGPRGTAGVGVCRDGVRGCDGGMGGACEGAVVPSEERCDVATDEDCDGAVDEGCACGEGDARPCGLEVGACVAGRQMCAGGVWGGCEGGIGPIADACNGIDEDCDGEVDEGLTRPCYGGADGTEGVGVCRGGVQRCDAGGWAACDGEVRAGEERCDGRDEDCDGATDEGTGGAACHTERPGVCGPGTEVCVGGAIECRPDVAPANERCDGSDEDCDGLTDEAFPDLGSPCAVGVGACRVAGRVTCDGCDAEPGLPSAEVCDGVDQDCDGAVDEGVEQPCFEGPEGAGGVCRPGARRCVGGVFGACEGQVLPGEERCDGTDEDCDGVLDEGVGAPPCYDGDPAELEAPATACRAGARICVGGARPACSGEVRPAAEDGCNDVNDDCDGAVDEDCACQGGAPCAGSGVGRCEPGVQVCEGDEVRCEGRVEARAEGCDGIDEDCDGATDEGLDAACYGGPGGTAGVGACRAGVRRCVGGAVGACEGEVRPMAEGCNGADDDCDGATDEAFPGLGDGCVEGVGACAVAGVVVCDGDDGVRCNAVPGVGGVETCDGGDEDCDGATDEGADEMCYGGPQGTAGVGACRVGSRSCANGELGPCLGEVRPEVEACDGAVDQDCDGQVDEGCECADGQQRPCGDEVGACEPGVQTCTGGGWGLCEGGIGPVAEDCDGVDDDCDGDADEGIPDLACYEGPDGTLGVGICRGGWAACDGGIFGDCGGQVLPAAEGCDGRDEDCDGATDEAVPGIDDPCDTGRPGVCGEGRVACDGELVCKGPEPAVETCDGRDEDCDGQVDEDTGRLAPEICGTQLDEDCDGEIDEGPDLDDVVEIDGSPFATSRMGTVGNEIGFALARGDRMAIEVRIYNQWSSRSDDELVVDRPAAVAEPDLEGDDDRVCVAWVEAGVVWGMITNDDARLREGPFELGRGRTPHVVRPASGCVVAWVDGELGRWAVVAENGDARLGTLGDRRVGNVRVARQGDDILFGWLEDGRVLAAPISGFAVAEPPYELGQPAREMALTGNRDGLVAAWLDETGALRARGFDAAGSLGALVELAPATPRRALDAATDASHLLLAWMEAAGLYAVTVDVAGTPSRAPWLAVPLTALMRAPLSAVVTDDHFALSWNVAPEEVYYRSGALVCE